MTFSLNEVEATAKKATRGAGYPWGLAEDAGKAVRWLCAQDLDGCGMLAALLDRFDGTALADITPQIGDQVWQAPGGMLCPLITGCALSDDIGALEDGPLQIGPVAVPGLLLPFAAYVARRDGHVVRIAWSDGAAVLNGAKVSIAGNLPATAGGISITTGGSLDGLPPRQTRAAPDPSDWETLNRFAHRTYAPATEESRAKGAGAGIVDRD